MDNYTKTVLTIIAACLVLLTLNQVNLIPQARASSEISESTLKNYGLVPLNEKGEVAVSISNLEEVKVDIVGISSYDELKVDIAEIGGGFVSSGGPLEVKVE
ncbi:hypothetical protein [Halocola ammonii]